MKRFAVILLALVMMFAVCAIAEEAAEEVTEEIEAVEEVVEEIAEEVEEEVIEEEVIEEEIETTPMYVVNCGTVTVWSEPDYNSAPVCTVMYNLEVAVTGEPVENGWYAYYPVTVDGNDGYILVNYLAEEREMRNMTGICNVEKGLKVHTAPSLSAPLVKKSYLNFGMIPYNAIFEIEYYIGGEWAYLTVEIGGVKEELGYACYRNIKTGVYYIQECDPTVTATWIYNATWYNVDPWNDLRG